jgi:hypothetical protein
MLLLALLIISPNLAWNATHGFPTFAHTEANANWAHAKYNFGNVGTFIAGQFGVFGPFMMAGFAGALWQLRTRSGRNERVLLLTAFSFPILLLVIVQSFISEANANWAAAAYIAAAPLATAHLVRWWHGRALWASLAVASVVMICLWAAELDPALADSVGLGSALKRQQGWKELGKAVATEASHKHVDAIAAANRSVLAELLYYARPREAPIRAWDQNTIPHDHFQMTMPLTSASHSVLLVVTPEATRPILATFESERLIRRLSIPLGRRHVRVLALYEARGSLGPQASH